MRNQNLMPGFTASAALMSLYFSPLALAQYNGSVTEFDQKIPYQSQQPTEGQNPNKPNIYVPPGMAVNQNGELYTPNINGVPINPNVPRAGLDKHGFDPYGNAYNQFTTPQMNYRIYPPAQAQQNANNAPYQGQPQYYPNSYGASNTNAPPGFATAPVYQPGQGYAASNASNYPPQQQYPPQQYPSQNANGMSPNFAQGNTGRYSKLATPLLNSLVKNLLK